MQAAGGAPLTTQEEPPDTDGAAVRSRPRARLVVLLFGLAAALYAVDVATKIIAVARLDGSSNVEVLGPWLTLTLVRNPGAAFSTGTQFTAVLSVISILAALVVLWLSRRVGSLGWAVGLGLLLAGVLGNLTDRLLRQPGPFEGHVIDFLRLPNWPVFNVADMCINVAAAIILVQAFRGVRIDGTRDGDHSDGDHSDGDHSDGGPDEHPDEDAADGGRADSDRADGDRVGPDDHGVVADRAGPPRTGGE